MPLSPVLREQATYPFVRLAQAAAEREASGLEVIDFGTGDPQEPTHPRIMAALRDGVRERMGYPAATGLPELREAIAAWIRRRFGVDARSGHPDRPDARQQGGDLHLRARRPRSRRGKGHGDPDGAGLSRAGAWRAVRRRPGRRVAAARGATRFSPPSRPWTRTTGHAPRSSGSTIPTTRPGRRPRSPSTSASRSSPGSTASCSPRTRPTASSGSTSLPPLRSSSKT